MASVINQIQSNGINYAIAHSAFGICDTPADNPNKTVTLCTGGDTSNNNFKLIDGVTVTVKFLYGDEADTSLLSLNVNNTGPQYIFYNGLPVGHGVTMCDIIKPDHIYQFVYRRTGTSIDDTRWEIVGSGLLDSDYLCIEYDSDNNTINYTIEQIVMYLQFQVAYRGLEGEDLALEDQISIVSKIKVFMDTGMILDCIGMVDDGVAFGRQFGNYFMVLYILNDNSVEMEIIPMQLEINEENPLSAAYISGLGSAAFTESTQYAVSSHNHSASNITSGTLPNGRLPSRLAEINSTTSASTAHQQGWHYINSGTSDVPPFKQVDGQTGSDYRIMSTAYSDKWWQQIATDFRSNDMFIRRNQNGTLMPWTPIVKMQPCTGTNGNVMPTVTNNAIALWDTSRNATVKNSDVTITTTVSGSDTIVTFA